MKNSYCLLLVLVLSTLGCTGKTYTPPLGEKIRLKVEQESGNVWITFTVESCEEKDGEYRITPRFGGPIFVYKSEDSSILDIEKGDVVRMKLRSYQSEAQEIHALSLVEPYETNLG